MVDGGGMVSRLAIVGVWVKVAVGCPTVVAGLRETTPDRPSTIADIGIGARYRCCTRHRAGRGINIFVVAHVPELGLKA